MNPMLNTLVPSQIRRFNALAEQTPGCIKLTLGEPDFDTPQAITQAAIASLRAGRTHYGANQGELPLRQAIAQWERKRGMEVSPEQILVTEGATGALFTALLGVLRPGSKCVIPTPAFPLYETIVRIAGAQPVLLDTAPYGFQIPEEVLEEVLDDRVDAVILCSPNNPTGCVFSQETLKNVAKATENKGIYLICDNVYQSLCDIPCPDLSLDKELADRVLVCQSFSKPYAMTGWRAGYLVAPRALMEKLLLVHVAQNASVTTFVQDACVTALREDVSYMAESYRERREFVWEKLNKMGLKAFRPQGAFYVFPRISHLGLEDEEFCVRAIREAGVALVPGSCFGSPGHVRVSCCVRREDLEQAMERLERFVKSL